MLLSQNMRIAKKIIPYILPRSHNIIGYAIIIIAGKYTIVKKEPLFTNVLQSTTKILMA